MCVAMLGSDIISVCAQPNKEKETRLPSESFNLPFAHCGGLHLTVKHSHYPRISSQMWGDILALRGRELPV